MPSDRPRTTLLIAAVALTLGWGFAAAQTAPDRPPRPTAPGGEPATDPPAENAPDASEADDEPDAAEVMGRLLDKLDESPLIEPDRREQVNAPAGVAGGPPALLELDPDVIGPAPGEGGTGLRREGEFVIERRGRLVRAGAGGYSLFVFEADAPESPEPPMVLLPCRMLENMENLVRDRGDQLVFILTGQVFVYRGANYLLPSAMRLAVDDAELRP